MKDDFSELETGASCYVLNSSTTIYSYKGGVRSSYVQVGGKWYKTAQSAYSSVPNSSICFSYSDITAINSKAEYFPIYEFIAIILAVFVWWFVFKLVSRLFRWRV